MNKENKSLNDFLYSGPVLLQDLTGLLLHFRLNRIALVADIEKAYLQIRPSDDSIDVTRFIFCETEKTSKITFRSTDFVEFNFE